MATEFIHSLKPSGGDYTSIGTWESDIRGDLTDGTRKVWPHSGRELLVAGDSVEGATSGATGTIVGEITSTHVCIDVATGTFNDTETVEKVGQPSAFVDLDGDDDSVIHVLECYKGDYSGVGGGQDYVQEAVDFTASTSNSTNYLIIRTPLSERHDGRPNTGFTIKTTFSNQAFYPDTSMRFIGLQIEHSGNQTYHRCFNLAAAGKALIDSCICILTNPDAQGVGIVANQDGATVRNSLIITRSTRADDERGTGISGGNYVEQYCENNTIVGFTLAIGASNIQHNDMTEAVNNIAYNCKYFTSSSALFKDGSKCNASHPSDARLSKAPQPYPYGVTAKDFIDADNDDFRLRPDSPLNDFGERPKVLTVTPDDSYIEEYEHDIVGNPRKAWSLGAFEGSPLPIKDYQKFIAQPVAKALLEPNLAIPKKQPLGEVEIDWTHPLTKHLTLCVLGGFDKELVNGYYISKANGAHVEGTAYGKGYDFTGGGTGTEVIALEGSQNRQLTNGQDISIYWLGIKRSTDGTFIARRDSVNVEFQLYSGSSKLSFKQNIGPSLDSTSTITLGYNGLGVSYDASTTNGVYYQNGERDGTFTCTNDTTQITAPASLGARWQGYPTTGYRSEDTVCLCLVWYDRIITDAEMRELHKDPYQFLKPKRQAITLKLNRNKPKLPVAKAWLEPNLAIPKKKPTGPVEIDWSHPLAKGLKFFTIFNNGAFVDLVNKDTATITVNNGEIKYENGHGSFAVGAINNSLVSYDGRDIVATNGLTFATNVRPAEVGTFKYWCNLESPSDATEVIFWQNGATLRLSWGVAAGTSIYKGTTIVAEEWQSVAASMDSTGDPTKSKLYYQGKLVASPTTGGTAITPDDMDQVNIGNRSTGARGWDGHMEYMAVWETQLSDTDYQSFERNPYQFLKPKQPLLLNKKEPVSVGKKWPLLPSWVNQRTTIDYSNPITRGLIAAFNFTNPQNGFANLVTGKKMTVNGTPKLLGGGLSCGVGNYLTSDIEQPTDEITILVEVTLAGGGRQHMACFNNGTNDVASVRTNTSETLEARNDSGTAAGTTLGIGRRFVGIGSWQDESSDLYLYLDGIQDGFDSTSNIINSNTFLSIGAEANGGDHCSAGTIIHRVYVWNRKFQAGEAKLISHDLDVIFNSPRHHFNYLQKGSNKRGSMWVPDDTALRRSLDGW